MKENRKEIKEKEKKKEKKRPAQNKINCLKVKMDKIMLT